MATVQLGRNQEVVEESKVVVVVFRETDVPLIVAN
jgi:hypothetical protein